MCNRHDALPPRAGWPPSWQSRPGEVLVGVIDRYAIGHTPQGPVRLVIVSEEPTGERVSLWLSSTSLLSLFAQYRPQPGGRISVRYRWRGPGQEYSRWMLSVDYREIVDFSPLGGEACDEAPWHRESGVAVKRLELPDTTVFKEWPELAVYRWSRKSLYLQVIERFCKIWRRAVTSTRLLMPLAPLKRALHALSML
jgi:hypothetical protein